MMPSPSRSHWMAAPGNEDSAFEGVFHRLRTKLPGNSGKHALMAADGFCAGMEEHKRTRTIRILGEPFADAGLTEERGLLVTGYAGNRNGCPAELLRICLGADGGGRYDLRQYGLGNVESLKDAGFPAACADVEEQGTGGVGDVGYMLAATGQIPDQPGIDGAEGNLTSFGSGTQMGILCKQPGDLGGREIWINQQVRSTPANLVRGPSSRSS
jgi:hypothetical protein